MAFLLPALLLCLVPSISAQKSQCSYAHAFQNFDDDVDRIKRYSNFFGGDAGIMDGRETNPQISLSCSDTETRTKHGRSLKISYGPLNYWSAYIESFHRQWYNRSSFLNLTDLFPDFVSDEFIGRKIDSIVFHCKLVASDPLSMKVELHDTADQISEHFIELKLSARHITLCIQRRAQISPTTFYRCIAGLKKKPIVT